MKTVAALTLAFALVGCAAPPPCADVECARKRGTLAAALDAYGYAMTQQSRMYQDAANRTINQMAPARPITCQYEPVTRMTHCR